MMEFYVSGQSLKMFTPVIAADSLKYLTAQFHFTDGEWDGYTRWAHFRRGETVYDIALDGENRITEEDALNLTTGEWEIYLTGTKDTARLTTVVVVLTVKESGLIDAPLHVIPQSVAEQIDAKAAQALLTAQAVKAAADAGKFNGKDGAQGPAGPVGPQGAQGIQGPAGIQGEQGERGERGIQGEKGEKGDTGAKGPQGDKGDKGDTGAQGPQGAKGSKGDPFTYGDFTTEQLEALTGPRGEKGEKGDTGATGPRGVQGAKGDTGAGFQVLGYYASVSALEAAVTSPKVGDAYGIGTAQPYDIYILDGTTGGWVNNGPLQGAKGDKGDKGDAFTYDDFTPEQLASLKGAKGDKGDTGSQGLPGAKGDKGDAFTYEDFTYEQLAALKGEKGDKGDKGDTGAQGVPGEKGEKGDTGAQGPQGEQGPRGVQGPQGEQGETGPAGAQGDKGDAGTPGAAGSPGATFTPHIDGSGNLSWTNDGGLENPSTQNIRGAAGAKGDTGPAGKSAYAAAVEAGYTGTEETFYAALTAMPYHNARHLPDGADPITVKAGNIDASAVETAKIKDKAVTTAKIADHAVSVDYTTTLNTTWSGSAVPYTKEQTVNGILASDKPLIDLVPSATFADAEKQADAWANVYRAVTAANKITFYAKAKPAVSIPLQIRCIRK